VERHRRALVALAVIALVGLLAGFAVRLVSSQADDRRDVEKTFEERSQTSASLIAALFGSATASSQQQDARQYGSAHVTNQQMGKAAKQGNSQYTVLVDNQGRILAASPGISRAELRSIVGNPPYVRQALAGAGGFAVGNLERPGGVASIGSAQGFQTDFGQRALVSGISPQFFGAFLGGYLAKVPSVEGGQGYILDQHNVVLGSQGGDVAIGQPVQETGLVSALAGGDAGAFDGDRYFTVSKIEATPWRVVLTASQSSLYASVNGSHKWVPWILFGAFAAAALLALWMLARVLGTAAKLETANDRLGVVNETLERRAGELTRSNEELERFASIASHDLKEPLRKMQTYADRLKETEAQNLSDRGREYVEQTSSAAERMQALIDDLLRFSRITAEVHPPAEVDLTEVAHKVVASLDAVIEESGASVEIGQLPTVFADPVQMHQLLQNLISNGLKFRREDTSPVVRVRGEVHGRLAEITVADNGVGFDPKYANRIFRAFERLHDAGEYPGTGIGLALCRGIVERHGGTISADSAPGQGSTFTVSLPVRPLAEATPAGEGPGAESKKEPLVHA
jgi:signal transduction histidine kinase